MQAKQGDGLQTVEQNRVHTQSVYNPQPVQQQKESEETTMKNLLAFLTQYKAKKAQLDSLTEEINAMKTELESYTIANNKPDNNGKYRFVCGQYTVTITPCTRTDIDKKRLEAEKPEIAEEYKKTTEYNRTTVK